MDDEERIGESGPDSDERQSGRERLVFHYSRERRLERASESVRRAYAEGPIKPPGLFKGLVATRGSRSIFAVIVVICIAIVAQTLLRQPENEATPGGVPAKLQAFLFEESVYVTVSLGAEGNREGGPLAGRVAVVRIVARDGSGAVVHEEELRAGYSGTPVALRTVFRDYEVTMVTAELEIGDTRATLTAPVDRK
ncbi:MAG TPA: hypothetical protein PLU93_06075 [Treponemataceae bacterium]|nr:hypothetical protein [Treponemataceae bacterium]